MLGKSLFFMAEALLKRSFLAMSIGLNSCLIASQILGRATTHGLAAADSVPVASGSCVSVILLDTVFLNS